MKSATTLFLLLSFFFIGHSSCDFQQQKSENQIAGYPDSFIFYSIKKVVDGDTFWIADGSKKGIKVRLLGIDAPESRKTGRKEIGYYGAEAKAYLKRRLLGQQVRLAYDVQRYDKYHRTLAYVYLEDGTFLNEELIKEGYATVLTIPPNVKYADLLLRAQRQAQKHQSGLWNK
jgi:micrococcal nuclease